MVTLEKTRKLFSQEYAKRPHVSVLIARQTFEQRLEDGCSLSDANEILESTEKFKRFLKGIHVAYQQSEQGKLEQLLKNTSFKNSFGAGLISGAVLLVVQPFIAPIIQRASDEIFKNPSKETSVVVDPAPSVPALLSGGTTINNYYFGINEARVSKPSPPVEQKSGKQNKRSYQPK